jgi:CDP-paratose 2-epimerase
MENSASLQELTKFCQEFSGKRIEIGRIAETREADIPFYVSDCAAVQKTADWKPQRKLNVVLENVCSGLSITAINSNPSCAGGINSQ